MRRNLKAAPALAVLAVVMLTNADAGAEPTAVQVRDDETTLKAFVEEAKAHIEAITDMNEGAKLREKLKTEDDWKSGSMFLVIFLGSGEAFIHRNDRTAEIKNLLGVEDDRGAWVVSGGGATLFHGSEPYREGKSTDMKRTDSKGMKIAEELIGGARREGRKSLRYHYDNPAIEGDMDTGSPSSVTR